VESVLKTTGISIADPKNGSEYPRINALSAVNAVLVGVGPIVYDNKIIDDDNSGGSIGDGDGIAECGETIELNVTLRNQGYDPSLGVNATLSSSDQFITITDSSESYPDIPGGGTREDIADYDFQVASNTPDGHLITFDLDITASNGGPWSDSFNVPVECNNPPNEPVNPTPADNATNVSINTDLGWTGGDPDTGDIVTYDVYVEANDSSPDQLLCHDVSAPACDPGTLSYYTQYYWQVIASDNQSASNSGPIWDFTSIPDSVVGSLIYDGHLVDDDTMDQSNGNNDGVMNCGEDIELYVDLYLLGTGTATGVNAAIDTDDYYLSWEQSMSSSYPDILGGRTTTNTNDFDFNVPSNTPDSRLITFDLHITALNGGTWYDSFDVLVTCTAELDYQTFLPLIFQ